MKGVDVFLDTLVDEDATVLFGNPGSTELPLIAALATRRDLRYVLGLQESTVVGMADGYSRTTGRPCVVNLHAAAGLGNGIGNLTNAVAHRAPIVVTAGNADRRHAIADPLLSGDLVTLSSGVSKWSHEARSARELGTVMRRAFLQAASHPRGPVFVSLPSDVLEEEGPDVGVRARSVIAPGHAASGIDEVARLLTDLPPEQVAIVAGDAVADADALGPLQELAERLGCQVFGSPFYSRRVFPTTHPQWRGMIDARADAIAKALAPFTRVLVVDYQPFLVYPYTDAEPVPAHVELLHLCPEATQVGRTHPVRLGMVGDPRASLEALVAALPASLTDDGGGGGARLAAERQAADTARV
ncbi:MAG: thiamine pyrophosphate-binding protein, partial [Acidimicrobiia bacterium]